MTKAILSAVVLLTMVISFAGCDWDHDHWEHDDYYRTTGRYSDRYYADHDRDWDRVHGDHDWYHDRDDD